MTNLNGAFFFSEAAHFPESDPQFKDLLAGDPDATWNDFAEICKMTSLPVIAKGIMSGKWTLREYFRQCDSIGEEK